MLFDTAVCECARPRRSANQPAVKSTTEENTSSGFHGNRGHALVAVRYSMLLSPRSTSGPGVRWSANENQKLKWMWWVTFEVRRGGGGLYHTTLGQSVGHPGEGAAAVLHLGQTEMDECWAGRADSCRETRHTVQTCMIWYAHIGLYIHAELDTRSLLYSDISNTSSVWIKV